jgi:L-cystine uptake protein TcyP (sodium:dicarboxylate symporter family)
MKIEVQNNKIWGGIGIIILGSILCLTLIGAIIGIPLMIFGFIVSCSGVRFN